MLGFSSSASKSFFVGFVDQANCSSHCWEPIARVRMRSELSSGMSLSLPKTNCHPCRCFGWFHLKRSYLRVRCESVQTVVDRGVEEFAASDGTAGLGDREFRGLSCAAVPITLAARSPSDSAASASISQATASPLSPNSATSGKTRGKTSSGFFITQSRTRVHSLQPSHFSILCG